MELNYKEVLHSINLVNILDVKGKLKLGIQRRVDQLVAQGYQVYVSERSLVDA